MTPTEEADLVRRAFAAFMAMRRADMEAILHPDLHIHFAV